MEWTRRHSQISEDCRRVMDALNSPTMRILRDLDARRRSQLRLIDDTLHSSTMRLYQEHVERMERMERLFPVNPEPELFTVPHFTFPKAPRPVVNVFNINIVSHEDIANE